mmetsp:Transcript_11404/g.23725  ORF Transcript_11404/g.23725 Transcript_11404/m.23725 type:complete len:137 (-) Transcript_11404:1624-2034(-)
MNRHGNANQDGEMNRQEQLLEEIRLKDPLLYFSIPGSSRDEFIRNEEARNRIIEYIRTHQVRRHTGVSCELHQDQIFEEIVHDIKIAQEQNHRHNMADAGGIDQNGRTGQGQQGRGNEGRDQSSRRDAGVENARAA